MTDSDDDVRARANARVGTVLRGKYTVERVIGIGGMASVYAASHRNGRRVALKLLHPELSLRADLKKRFLREGHAANAVRHNGVVAVIDDDVAEDGAAFLVMELLEGQSIEELWEAEGRKLSTKSVLRMASDLCAVLAVAHDAGVIHRDLKPANLFVTQEGELKVLDFGIARVRDAATSSATSTGAIFGTPAFMAPEQAGGLVNELGPLTDIWAVGATMYTLLSGRPVHDGQSGQHIAILAATRPAASLSVALPDAPPEVVAIVDRALAFDKADRWQSAAAMRSAMEEALTRFTQQEAAEAATLARGTLSETMLAVAGVKPLIASPGTLASRGNNAPFLGGTTGQPVSSGAVAEKETKPNILGWRRRAAAIGRWVRDRGPEGPGSDEAPTRRRFAPRLRMVAAAAAVAFVSLAALSISAVITRHEALVPATSSVPSSEELPEAPAPSSAVASSDSRRNEKVAAGGTEPAEPARPAASFGARVLKSAPAKPRSGTTPATPPRLNCNPPFTVQDGIQIHKPGCP